MRSHPEERRGTASSLGRAGTPNSPVAQKGLGENRPVGPPLSEALVPSGDRLIRRESSRIERRRRRWTTRHPRRHGDESCLNCLIRQAGDKFHHFRVVIANPVRAPLAHHLLRIGAALNDRDQDSLFRRAIKAHTALLEYASDERMDLVAQLRVRRGLIQDFEELSVRALKASEQLVSDELRGHVLVAHWWGMVYVGRLVHPLGVGSITLLYLRAWPSFDGSTLGGHLRRTASWMRYATGDRSSLPRLCRVD